MNLRTLLFSGVLLVGWTANAQTTSNNSMSSDSTPRQEMHRHWGNHNGSDSLARRDGFRAHRDGGNGFGPGDRFGRGNGIRYTQEQRKQVASINSDYRTKAADLFKNDNLTLRQYKAQLVALNKEKKTKLQALITPQQKDQLAARKKRSSENRQVAEAAHMERLKLRLSLTDDQVAKLKANMESFRAQAKTIRDNDDLLPQQKAEQFKDLMAKNKDSYKSVLTPDQLSKFQQMHHRGGPGGEGHGGGFRGHHPGGPGGPNGPGNDDGDSK